MIKIDEQIKNLIILERKLLTIWIWALNLSKDQYCNIDYDQSFKSLLPSDRATTASILFKAGIRDQFEISSEEVINALLDLDTFGKQASLIHKSLSASEVKKNNKTLGD